MSYKYTGPPYHCTITLSNALHIMRNNHTDMRVRIVSLNVLITLILSSSLIHANNLKQTTSKHIRNYNIMQLDDMPQSEVNSIFQDSQGFMWLATLGGLYRFDGYEYKRFPNQTTGENNSSKLVLSMAEDNQGDLWFGTYGRGISMFNVKTQQFTNYPLSAFKKKTEPNSDIVSIIVDKKDQIWMSNGYIIFRFQIDKETSKLLNVHRYNIFDSNVEKQKRIKSLYKDKWGTIWIGINSELHRVVDYNDTQLKLVTYGIGCEDITEGQDGIYFGSGQIYFIQHLADNQYEEPVQINTIRCRRIIQRHHKLWVGNRNGLHCLSQNKRKQWVETISLNKETLPFDINSNVISYLYNNSFDQLWVGSRGSGTYYLEEKEKGFYGYQANSMVKKDDISNELTRCLYTDRKNNLWIGDEENGVFILPANEPFTGHYINIKVNREDNNRAYAFEETKSPTANTSIMWVGTSYPDKLIAINTETKQIIPQINGITDDLGFVFALKKTDPHTLWAGLYNQGLWRLKIDDSGHVLSGQQFNQSNSSISSNTIRSIFQDHAGNLWIGTDLGINRINKDELWTETPIFYHQIDDSQTTDLSNDYILDIKEDSLHNLYFGTMGSGLIIYRPANKSKLKRITTHDGLIDNTVKTILIDPKSENLWLATNHGLCKLDPRNLHVLNYSNNSGIQESEFSEICGTNFRGRFLVFGNRNGFVAFDPSKITENKIPPYLYLTDIYVNNQRLQNNQLPTPTEFLEKIELPYNDHNFAIDFVGIQLDDPNNIDYYYRLEGFDENWTKTSSNHRRATYTNLYEGTYIFEVRATNADGVWSEKTRKLEIVISPPFYRSTWAYLIYLILLGLILYLTYRILYAFYLRKQDYLRVQFEKEKSEEIAQYRFQFFTNMSHEFRTPLTLINIPLETLLNRAKHKQDSLALKDLNVIKDNADTLMDMINQLLEFRKVEQGKSSLKIETIDANRYVALFYKKFQPLATKQNIDFKFEPSNQNPNIDIDSKLFEHVLYNLLSNAFKYTQEGGRIILRLDIKDRRVIISIHDNGQGILPEAVSHIFDRFYQVNSTNHIKQKSTGIGLALSKTIVKQHHGTIQVESIPEKHTVFSISLALSTAQPQKSPYQLDGQGFAIDKMASDSVLPIHSSEQNKQPTSDRIEKQSSTPKELDTQIERLIEGEKQEHSHDQTILIVEDNCQLQEQLYQRLSNRFQIISANNGQEGLNACIKYEPQLILTDIVMPIMDGIEMCVQIKQNRLISHIPIIIFTANNTVKNRIDSFNIGQADAYLEKPFNMEALEGQINALLKSREAVKTNFEKDVIIAPEMLAHTKTDLEFITGVLNIIKAHMGDMDFTVQMLADEYGLSRTSLNKKIKALTDQTANHFLITVRMKYAAKLILQGDMNVNEVSWSVGYNDVNTFRTRFKEHFGVTPTAYTGLHTE